MDYPHLPWSAPRRPGSALNPATFSGIMDVVRQISRVFQHVFALSACNYALSIRVFG
jgi:hypothetical protein